MNSPLAIIMLGTSIYGNKNVISTIELKFQLYMSVKKYCSYIL